MEHYEFNFSHRIYFTVKIPSVVRITSKVSYQVVWVETLVKNGVEHDGFCDGEAKIIFLLLGMSKQRTERAYVHEFGHALDFEYDLKIPHWLIGALEVPILRVLRLNGWI